jgi:membrane fusion protein, multidrug efflux system
MAPIRTRHHRPHSSAGGCGFHVSARGGDPGARRNRLVHAALFPLLVVALGLNGSGCGKQKPPPPPPTVVKVMRIGPRDEAIYKEWVGTLAGDVDAEIYAQVTGYLISREYAEGSVVKKGQLLFLIDPRPFEATLDQAQAKLAQDQANQSTTHWNVQRYEPLAKENAVSQQEYITALESDHAALAQIKADQAAIVLAQVNLGFTRVTSLIDGLAGVARAQIGDLVGPTGPILTTVSTIDPIRAYFPVSEQDYLNYRARYTNETERAAHEKSLELQLLLANGMYYPYTGKFFFANREVSTNTGTIMLAGLFPNPSNLLRPGQFVRVRLQTEIRHGALVVPQLAVMQLQGGYQVATMDNQNRAHIQAVTVGEQVGSDWIIEKGLQPGEQVIVEGQQKIKEGMLVNPQRTE